MINLMGCNGGAVGDNSGGGPPPGPPTYDYEEVEPNDDFSIAQFITLLPHGQSQEDIGGFIDLPDDLDYYYFFLSPNLGQDEIKFNAIVETDPFIAPKVSLYQTIYDSFGTPTGEHQLIGTYIGVNGNLVILDVPIPYHSFTNNDLFLLLEGYTTINGYKGYVIDFWSSL
tara:strand:- start:1525 stop:2034 length:510 start_codon:yes stop_codon:yes gene_type:complete